MMKEVLGGGTFVHYTLITPKAAAAECEICTVCRLFLGPGNREPSWVDSSLPTCENKSGNSTTLLDIERTQASNELSDRVKGVLSAGAVPCHVSDSPCQCGQSRRRGLWESQQEKGGSQQARKDG